jgi:hypothetical protein
MASGGGAALFAVTGSFAAQAERQPATNIAAIWAALRPEIMGIFTAVLALEPNHTSGGGFHHPALAGGHMLPILPQLFSKPF